MLFREVELHVFREVELHVGHSYAVLSRLQTQGCAMSGKLRRRTSCSRKCRQHATMCRCCVRVCLQLQAYLGTPLTAPPAAAPWLVVTAQMPMPPQLPNHGPPLSPCLARPAGPTSRPAPAAEQQHSSSTCAKHSQYIEHASLCSKERAATTTCTCSSVAFIVI
jgi:hypothetical protein